ncbi:c-type cytochrome [Steroidobacter flavus]|uniref:C-type cytochrome n=1 Tax=Steroidobacter flavus TaxID=1842136 RepID=A0ABV8SLV3_9GAMM
MKFCLIPALVLPLVLAACAAQPTQREVTSMSGLEMYQSSCASCHGVGGEGDGPVAPLVKIHVADLTRIAHRHGGEFPAEDVHRTIDGRFEHPAHGPRDMPVWGWQFYRSETMNDPAERARVDALIDRLVEYLRTIQKS